MDMKYKCELNMKLTGFLLDTFEYKTVTVAYDNIVANTLINYKYNYNYKMHPAYMYTICLRKDQSVGILKNVNC